MSTVRVFPQRFIAIHLHVAIYLFVCLFAWLIYFIAELKMNIRPLQVVVWFRADRPYQLHELATFL